MRTIRALVALLCVGTTAVVSAEPPSAGAPPQDAFTPHLAGALQEPSLILVSRERSRLRYYRVIVKSQGPFGGGFADFYGGHWIKVNYPGEVDAARGLDAGLVTAGQALEISTAWAKRLPTNERTKLGGGIGFHGWNGEWAAEDGGTFLSWGCVVMHNDDIAELYPLISAGTAVVIF